MKKTERRAAGNRRMRRGENRLVSFLKTVSVSICLILITAFFVSETVMSREMRRNEADSKYYRELSDIYAEEMREFLKECGYADSGVTVTTVEKADGARSYTVTIHHGRIDRLTQTEKEELLRACRTVAFPDRACSVFHQFLEEDC